MRGEQKQTAVEKTWPKHGLRLTEHTIKAHLRDVCNKSGKTVTRLLRHFGSKMNHAKKDNFIKLGFLCRI